MSEKFEVYFHPTKGAWGYRASTEGVTAVDIDASGKMTTQVIPPMRLSSELTRRLRQGYAPGKRGLYLHVRHTAGQQYAVFDATHPDLSHPRDLEPVLTVLLPAAADKTQLLAETTNCLSAAPQHLQMASEWLDRLSVCTTYWASFVDHPALSLCLAQVARQNNMMVLARGTPPKGSPFDDPGAWASYLQTWFAPAHITQAQNELGISISTRINSTLDAALHAAEGDSNQPAPLTSWLDQGRSVSF